MTEEEFIIKMQRRIAQVSFGASALRNQGAPGVIRACRQFFEDFIDLAEFFVALLNNDSYQEYLNWHTEILRLELPPNARNWGTARKALNLFFRDIVYNKLLAYKLPDNFYEFNSGIQHMEIPIDKYVAKKIFEKIPDPDLKWDSISRLESIQNEHYQFAAQLLAKDENVARINLDLTYWRPEN